MIYAMQLLSDEARKLYGNSNISLTQAASYANTPEKQLLCYKGLRMTCLTYFPQLNSEEVYALNRKLRDLFPPLNHREQA